MANSVLFITIWVCFGFIKKQNILEMMEEGRLLFLVDPEGCCGCFFQHRKPLTLLGWSKQRTVLARAAGEEGERTLWAGV